MTHLKTSTFIFTVGRLDTGEPLIYWSDADGNVHYAATGEENAWPYSRFSRKMRIWMRARTLDPLGVLDRYDAKYPAPY